MLANARRPTNGYCEAATTGPIIEICEPLNTDTRGGRVSKILATPTVTSNISVMGAVSEKLW